MNCETLFLPFAYIAGHMYAVRRRVGYPVTSRPVSPGATQIGEADRDQPHRLEQATRGLLEVTITILERMDKTTGLTELRALQSLQRRGPSQVTALANDLDILVSTASRLSDRLAEADLITRRVSPTNRRATQLDLTDHGRQTLNDLVAMRATALREVTDHMTPDDLEALLTGAQAFTTTRDQLAEAASAEHTGTGQSRSATATKGRGPTEPDTA